MMRTILLVGLLVCAAFPASAIFVSVDPIPETCNNANGRVYIYVSGGTMPYTYAWTGPNGFTSTEDTLFNVESGTYTVVVTDFLGATATDDAIVQDLTELPPGFGPTIAGAMELTGYWGGACIGQCNGAGAFVDHLSGGTPPFNYNFDVSVQYLGTNVQSELGGEVYSGFCLGESVNYTFTDALGCPGWGSFVVYGVDESWFPVVNEIQGSCTGGNGGTATVTADGPMMSTHVLRLNGVVVDTQDGGMGSVLYFTDLAPGDHELETVFNSTQCSTTQNFTVPDLGPSCAAISGTSWYDVDGDCVHDVGEVGIPYSVLAVEPGGYYTITHPDGGYGLNLPNGNYTLAQTDATLVPICPATLPVPFTINNTPVVLDLASGSTQPLDLSLNTSTSPARPGFIYTLHAHVANMSPQVSGPVTLTCSFDPALTYVSATPTPSNVAGNTITWDIVAFGSYGSAVAHVSLAVPVSTPLGTVLTSSFSVSNTLPESNLANNVEVETTTVTGSFDPNAKEVRTSSQLSGTQYFIGTDQYLDYTIQFQNTGTDTAFTVVVTDTLDTDVDMATFQQGASSHPYTVDFLPDRVVRWTFADILLPDSNTNEAASHGLTSFRIRLHEPVVPGVTIVNAADIFFDFNPPVRTPDVVVVTETSTSVEGATTGTRRQLALFPNPASEQVRIVLDRPLKSATLTVQDAMGREVMHTRMSGQTRTLDVSALPSGLHLVVLRTEEGVMSQRLVVE